MDKQIEEGKTTQLQIRIREDLKEELRVAAALKGLTTSGLIHLLITRAIREAKDENPEAFGDWPQPNLVSESEFDKMLAEAFKGRPVSPNERQRIMELIKAALAVREVEGDGVNID